MEIPLLHWLLSVVAVLSLGVARDDEDEGACRFHAFVGHSRGFVCSITEPGLRSIPPNASALRLIPTATRSWLNLTVPSLPSLRTLEVDVTRTGALSPRPFARLSGLTQLQLFHSAAHEFRFDLAAGYFEGAPGLRKLFLPDLGIEDLPLGAFRGLGDLRILELHLNHLWRIRNGTFSGCCRLLSRLTLSMNRISDLRLVSLAGLSGLRSLDLSSNRLTSLPGHSFEGLSSLVSVNLERNSIHSVYPLAFAGLGNLKELTLNHNRLRDFPASGDVTGVRRSSSFDGLTSLETLELRGNDVTRVDFLDELSRLGRLTRLDLSQNRMAFLSIELFEGLSNLTDLDLSENQLTTLNEGFLGIFERLSNLDLSVNPWRCDCRLLWLTEWLITRASDTSDAVAGPVISGLDDTKCSGPGAGVQGVRLALHNNSTEQECRDKFTTSVDSVQSPESTQMIRQPQTTPEDNGHSTETPRINNRSTATEATDYVTKAVMTSPSIEMTSPSIEMTSPSIEMTSLSEEITSFSSEITLISAEMTSPSIEITSLSAELTSSSTETTSSSKEMTSSATEMTSLSAENATFSAEMTLISAELTSFSSTMTSSSTITAHDLNIKTQDDFQTTEVAEIEKPTTVAETATVESLMTRNSTVSDLLLPLLLPLTTTVSRPDADALLPSTHAEADDRRNSYADDTLTADDSLVVVPKHLQNGNAAQTMISSSRCFLFTFMLIAYESLR